MNHLNMPFIPSASCPLPSAFRQIHFSSEVQAVLSQYPKWLEIVIEARDKPVLDKNYCPHVIEIFDQNGLLAGKVNGLSAYECNRDIQQKSDFNAWLLDGELAALYIGTELVINRLEAIAVEGE